MSIVDEVGQRLVHRSWFERQFVRSAAGLHFREGPFAPVRIAPEAEQEQYIDLAMAYSVAVAGWHSVILFPLALVTTPFISSFPQLLAALTVDALIVWMAARYVPEVRGARRRVRDLVARWPVVAPPAVGGYFSSMWSGGSFARISARERRILLGSGLFFTSGGAMLAVMGSPIGRLALAMGLLSLLVWALAARAAYE